MKLQYFLLFLVNFGYLISSQTDFIPTFSRLYGDSFTVQHLQHPKVYDDQQSLYYPATNTHTSSYFTLNFGHCGRFLQQKIEQIIQLNSNSFLLGINGKLDWDNHNNMILASINSQGVLDENFGSHGYINLLRRQSEEYITGMIQNFNGGFFIAGYGDQGSILRCYDSCGKELWIADNNITGTVISAFALQGRDRLLVGYQITSNLFQLIAYDQMTGLIDTTFHSQATVPGTIDSLDFGLQIGCIHTIFGVDDNIVIVYTNLVHHGIDIAVLSADGSGLLHAVQAYNLQVSLAQNIFNFIPDIDTLHVTFDYKHRNVLALTQLEQRIIFVKTSLGYNLTNSIFSVAVDNVVIKKMVPLIDDSILLLGYNKKDYRPTLLRIKQDGTIDEKFSQDNSNISQFHTNFLNHKTTQYLDFYADCSAQNILLAGSKIEQDRFCVPVIMPLSCTITFDEIVHEAGHEIVPNYIDNSIESSIQGVINCTDIDGWQILADFVAYGVQANPDGTLYVLFSNGLEVIVGLLDSLLQPVTTYGHHGLSDIQELSSINSFGVDSQQRVVIAGAHEEHQKVIRLNSFGHVDKVVMFHCAQNVRVIGEQQSGIIVGIAQLNNEQAIYGYQNTGNDLVSSFGSVAHKGFFKAGCHCNVDGIVIDDQDALFIVWRDCWTRRVFLEKCMPNGAGLVSDFNYGTPLATDVFADGKAFIALNEDQNIAIVASTDQGIALSLYDGKTGQALAPMQFLALKQPCALQKIIGTGQDFVGMCRTVDATILFRFFGATGRFDTSSYGTHAGVMLVPQEYDTFFYNFSIQVDGKIVLAGAKSNRPLLLRLAGYDDIGEQLQAPGKSPAGTIDTTIFYTPPIVSRNMINYKSRTGTFDSVYGAFNFNSLSSGDFNLSGYVIQRFYVYEDGSILFVCDNGADTIVFRILPNVSLDTISNGGLGFNQAQTPGYIKISGCADATSLYVDENGIIAITGGMTTSWTRVYTADGVPLSTWNNPTDNLAHGAYKIGKQSFGRYLVAGHNGSTGVIFGYTLSGTLDEIFATNGVFITRVDAPIVDMFIDDLDNIVIVYVVDGATVIEKISPEGLSSTILDAGTPIYDITGDQVKIAQDTTGNIIVAAAVSDGFALRHYDQSGLNILEETIAIAAGASGSSYLGNLIVKNDGTVILVGYETTAHSIICMSFDANLNFDSNFNAGAPLVITNSPMNIACDVSIYLDARILIVGGSTTSPNPYMMRIFDDAYVTIEPQSPPQGIACTNDLTLAQTGTAGIAMYGLTGGSAQDQTAQLIIPYDDFNLLVALEGQSIVNNENRIFLNMVNLEGQLQSSFAAGGKVAIPHFYDNQYVRDIMLLTEQGNRKALLAGYIKNNNANITNSLLMKYNLTTQSIDTDFAGFAGDLQGVASGQGQKFYGVCQQSQGRIVTSGLDHMGHGLLVGYTPQGRIDRSFGRGGFYYQGTTGLYCHLLDDQNRIIVAYNDGNNNLAIARILADGSALDLSFHSTGLVAQESMISGMTGDDTCALAFDQDGNIIAAGVVNNGLDFQISRYSSDGVFDTTLVISSAMLGGTISLTISKILIDINGLITLVGYDAGVAGEIVCVQILPNLSGLDRSANSAGTAGYLKYAIAGGAEQVVNDALICQDGRIWLVGKTQ